MSVKTKSWCKAAGIRSIKTMAQTAVAFVGTNAAMQDMASVDWKMLLSVSVLAGILSLLTSIAGLPEVAEG